MEEATNESIWQRVFGLEIRPKSYNHTFNCLEYSSSCPECGGTDRVSVFEGDNVLLATCWGEDKGRNGCGKKFYRRSYVDSDKAPQKPTVIKKIQDFKEESLHLSFIKKSHQNIFKKEHLPTLHYAQQRGFTEDLIKKFALGSCFKRGRGLGLVLPVFQPQAYFQVRWIQWDKAKDFPKYQNPKGSKTPYALYGESAERCFVMESLIDAMLISEGLESASIAMMGAKTNPSLFSRYREVFLLADADEVGQRSIPVAGYNKSIPLPKGVKDVGELIQKKGVGWCKSYLQGVIDLFSAKEKKLEILQEPSKKATTPSSDETFNKPKEETSPKEVPLIEDISFNYVTSLEEAEAVIEDIFLFNEPIALDTETTGLDCFQNRTRLIQIYHPQLGCFLFDVFQIGGIDFFKPMENHHFVIQYAPFDVKMLRSAGINLTHYEDTKLMASLIWPIPNLKGEGKRQNIERVPKNLRIRDLSLFHLVRLFEGVEIDKSKKLRTGWSQLEIGHEKLRYAAYDVFYLHKVYEKLQERLEQRHYCGVYQSYRKALMCVIDMEYQGAPVKKKDLEKRMKSLNSDQFIQTLEEKYGIKNINSNKQLTEYVDNHFKIDGLKRTEKTNQINFSRNILKVLLPSLEGEERKFFEDLANLKIKESLLREHKKLLEAINPKTDRVHASYHLLGASSGRTITRNPNFQGQSSEVKAFIGVGSLEEGVITSADYSQQEMRIFAMLTKHKKLLESLEEGKDAYNSIASVALEKSPEEVTKEERKLFKMISLAILFGKGSKSLSEDLKLPANEARKKYTELKKILNVGYLQRQLEIDRELYKGVKTVFGETTRLIRDEWQTLKNYQLINYLIQGTASNIGVFALLELIKSLPERAKVIGFIHDEFLIEHPQELTDQVKGGTLRAMQNAFIESFPQAEKQRDYLVDIKTGIFWNKG